MSEPAAEKRLLWAAEPVVQQISDLARTKPPVVADLLRTISTRLLDSGFQVTKTGDRSKRRRDRHAIEFHKAVGLSLRDFVIRARLAVAQRLLMSTDIKVETIPELVGLSRSVFYEHFRGRFGKSPSELQASEIDEMDDELFSAQRGAMGPLFEISTHGFDEEVIAEWLAKAACELPAAQSRAALKETGIDSPALFETLCERSLEEGRRDPRRGVEIAELAVASAEGSASTLGDLAAALHARGLARLANARRLANDYPDAERELRRAEVILEKVATIHRPAVKAEIIQNRGTLRRYQRRFAEAREDLHRAIGLSRSTGQVRLEALAWMQLAATFFYEGDPEAARAPLLSASRIAETAFADDPFLRLGLVSQLACVQAESGNADEALVLLPQARKLAADLGHRVALLQADWIEAVARKGQRNTSAAEDLLIRAYEGFLSLGDTDHTAIVSLDLALLYEEQNRSAAVVSLAAEALPALEAMHLPEAAAAKAMLQRAIENDTISRTVLVDIRALLSPSMSFSSSQKFAG